MSVRRNTEKTDEATEAQRLRGKPTLKSYLDTACGAYMVRHGLGCAGHETERRPCRAEIRRQDAGATELRGGDGLRGIRPCATFARGRSLSDFQ